MNVISLKKLREFWSSPQNANAEEPLRAWHQIVTNAEWRSFADVRETFRSADTVGSKTVFNVGGNKFRVIAFIDYEAERVFIRYVMTHKEYDQEKWKNDSFGDDWKPFRDFIKEAKKRKENKT